jgi:hypothetical protein
MHKNYKKWGIPASLSALITLSPLVATSAVIDKPRFAVSGAVVVWGGDGAGNASVNDFIVASTSGNIDLIDSDVTPVITGSLDSFSGLRTAMYDVTGQTLDDQGEAGALDAGDAFSAFTPGETITTSVRPLSSSFYVAANTAFSIRAIATLDEANSSSGARLQDIYRTMLIQQSGSDAGGAVNYGAASQYPHSDNSPNAGILNNGFLNRLSTEKLVFQGNRGTAVGAGNLADQSVRFTNTYEVPDGDGLEAGARKISARVVYTIAIP